MRDARENCYPEHAGSNALRPTRGRNQSCLNRSSEAKKRCAEVCDVESRSGDDGLESAAGGAHFTCMVAGVDGE